jgi:hypothetical protein
MAITLNPFQNDSSISQRVNTSKSAVWTKFNPMYPNRCPFATFDPANIACHVLYWRTYRKHLGYRLDVKGTSRKEFLKQIACRDYCADPIIRPNIEIDRFRADNGITANVIKILGQLPTLQLVNRTNMKRHSVNHWVTPLPGFLTRK